MKIRNNLSVIAGYVIHFMEKKVENLFYGAIFVDEEDYHGFLKSKLRKDAMKRILNRFGIEPGELQIDIVTVTEDLVNKAHVHEKAHTVCVALDERIHSEFRTPFKSFVLIGDEWQPFQRGDVVYIPPGERRTFTVKPGGILYFLSIQSPEISEEHDDFALVEPVPLNL